MVSDSCPQRRLCRSEFYLGPGVARTSPIAEQSLVAKLMKCSDGANRGEMPERDKTHRKGALCLGQSSGCCILACCPYTIPLGERTVRTGTAVCGSSIGWTLAEPRAQQQSVTVSPGHTPPSLWSLAGCSDQLWLMMEGPPGVSGGGGNKEKKVTGASEGPPCGSGQESHPAQLL